MGESKAPPVLYRHAAQFMWRRTQYSTARDNGDSFSPSYTGNKAGKMQSTINQLKHGKGRAVNDNGTRGVVSIDQYSTRLRLVLYCYLNHTPHTIIARTALPSVL